MLVVALACQLEGVPTDPDKAVPFVDGRCPSIGVFAPR